MAISSKLPSQKQLSAVYAVIVLMVYGWTILKFNYNLPGWLYFQNLGEIAGLFAYSMVVNFLESLVVLLGVIAAGVILPAKWFFDSFVARGASLSILVLALMMEMASQFTTKDAYPAELVRWTPLILLLIFVLVFFIGRVKPLVSLLETFADRAIIFLYITIPLSLLSIVVVLARLV